jgi:hypothetical protein
VLRLGGKDKFCFLKIYDGSGASEIQVLVDDVIPGFDDVKSGRFVIHLFVTLTFNLARVLLSSYLVRLLPAKERARASN